MFFQNPPFTLLDILTWMCQNCSPGLKAENIQEALPAYTHSTKCVNALFLRDTCAGCYMRQPPLSIFFLALSRLRAPSAIMTHNTTMTLTVRRLQTVCTLSGNVYIFSL